MEKILITGAEGRIGQILVPALTGEYNTYGLDKKPSNKRNFLGVDITSKANLEKALKSISPIDYIVHLAGNPDGHASWEEIFGPNILGTVNVYECAKEIGVKKVIFASSTHIIGSYPGWPQGPIDNGRIITADDPPRPDGYYGTSKLFGEGLARQFYELHNLQSICIRIGAFRSEEIQDPDDIYKKISISSRDLIQLVTKGLKKDIAFGIYFGISNNPGTYLDISNAKKDLGYSPLDSFS